MFTRQRKGPEPASCFLRSQSRSFYTFLGVEKQTHKARLPGQAPGDSSNGEDRAAQSDSEAGGQDHIVAALARPGPCGLTISLECKARRPRDPETRPRLVLLGRIRQCEKGAQRFKHWETESSRETALEKINHVIKTGRGETWAGEVR